MPVDHTGPPADDKLRYVERFAIALVDTGMARMPARVFSYALIDDADRYTVGELAEALRVSPAAVSVAVRDLVRAGLLSKERQPGERSDTYVMSGDNVWSDIYLQRSDLLGRFEQLAAEGVELLGTDGPGGRRLADTRGFFAFLRREFPVLLERWQEERRRARSG